MLAAFLLLFAKVSSAVAPCGSTAACLQVIQQAQGLVQTLAADFTQVKHVSLLDEPLVSTGHFTFKRPDNIALEIERPTAATVIIRGQDVEIPNLPERERQALAMAPIGAMFGRLGALFAGDLSALQQDFEVTAHADGDAIAVTLVPRRAEWQNAVRSIDLRFAVGEGTVQTIRLDDAVGDSLEITLQNVRRNIEVPDSLFAARSPQPTPAP